METLDIGFNVDTSALANGMKEAAALINSAFQNAPIKKDDIHKPMTEMFQALQHSSDRAIAGMIRGTENWHRAVSNIIDDIEIKFVQLASHRLINWMESELGMTEATTAGNAARMASDQAASSFSLSAIAQKAVSAIYNDAKEVFAGIYAFLSPLMGPAAAGPAAAGSASVAALASGITYAESGAWNISANTLAYLHAGEMVVPQSFASSLREGNGFGSGDSYTININAIDTQTGMQFLKNNASHIASILSSQVRNFNGSVPVWKS
jgi:hypothetical protein